MAKQGQHTKRGRVDSEGADQPVKHRKTSSSSDDSAVANFSLDDVPTPASSTSSESDADSELSDIEDLEAVSPLTTPAILGLPTEILLLIFSYLRTEVYTSFILPFICKSFRTLLHVPAESDFASMHLSREDFEHLQKRNDETWQFRCAVNFGVYWKFAHNDNWETTYRKNLRHHCMRCGRKTWSEFGEVWTAGPNWAVVCLKCQSGKLFGTIRHSTVMTMLDPGDFEHLPYFWGKGKECNCYECGERVYYEASILQIQARKHKEMVESIISEYKGDHQLLRAAIESVDGVCEPSSPKLHKLVERLLYTEHSRKSLYSAVVDHYVRLLEIPQLVTNALEQLGISIPLKSARPSLTDYPRGMEKNSANPHVWSDAIAAKHKTVKEYVTAVSRIYWSRH